MKTLPPVLSALLWTGLAPVELQIQKVWPEKAHCPPGGRLATAVARRRLAVPTLTGLRPSFEVALLKSVGLNVFHYTILVDIR